MEYRIYANGKLVSICGNEYVYMCNLVNYDAQYGKENVAVKMLNKHIKDKEYEDWLKII